MQADRSQVGFALMDPAFLRALSGETTVRPVVRSAGWRVVLAGFWAGLMTRR